MLLYTVNHRCNFVSHNFDAISRNVTLDCYCTYRNCNFSNHNYLISSNVALYLTVATLYLVTVTLCHNVTPYNAVATLFFIIATLYMTLYPTTEIVFRNCKVTIASHILQSDSIYHNCNFFPHNCDFISCNVTLYFTSATLF